MKDDFGVSLAFGALVAALLILFGLLSNGKAHAQAAPMANNQSFDVPMTSQDGQNITQICTLAMNGTQTLQTKTAIGQVCLDLIGRMGVAEKARDTKMAQMAEDAKRRAHEEHVSIPPMGPSTPVPHNHEEIKHGE